ncbi:MFS transporter [Paraburkholderia sp. D1E]|uniref:MFS transporter n=1 Tax=Paraburkholderia sp. D1E TaxID=3461398 RepID=UPI004045476E
MSAAVTTLETTPDHLIDATALRQTPLPLSSKIAYSAGSFVDAVTNNVLTVFGLFYVTAVCGVSGGSAGVALSAGLVVDAVLDPLIGSISDGWRSRLGRRLPFMLLGLPLSMIAFVMIFSLPKGASATTLFVTLLLLSIVLRVSVSLFNLPFLALGAELTDDYAERSRVAAWRWGLGMIAGLATVLIGFGIFFRGPDGLSQKAAYPPFAMTCAAVAIAGALAAIWGTFVLRDRAHPIAVDRPGWLRALLAGLAEIFRNRSFRILFGSSVLFFVAQGVALSLGLHANTYFWRLSGDSIKIVMLAYFCGLLTGAPLIGMFSHRFDKKRMLLVSLGVLIVTQALPASLRLAGMLPFQGMTLATMLAANAAIGGFGLTAAAIAVSSMLADAADEHEYIFGSRREGLYFAGWAFAGKVATGGGALIAGLVLQFSGFPSGAAAKAGAQVALRPETVTLLGLCYGPGAALFSIAGVLILLLYRLDRPTHARILEKLIQQRTG